MKKKESAAQSWKGRMRAAKESLEGVGQQKVIEKVIELDPDVDSLANSTRWRNAWLIKVADPQFTLLVEETAKFYRAAAQRTRSRVAQQKLAGRKLVTPE